MRRKHRKSIVESMSVWILGAVLATLVTPRAASAAWPPFGRPICTAPATQQHPVIAADGTGGAIIAWQDFRIPRVNIFAHHVLASGELDSAWPTDGRPLLTDALAMASADGGQVTPVIVPDGAGGAIVAWQDLRSQATEIDVFAQHVLATGAVDTRWAANGTALCIVDGVQNSLAMVPDGAGGAIITWMDARLGVGEEDIFAQHILASGAVDSRWPANGLPVCAAPGRQDFPVIVEDGSGGAIITWGDSRPSTTGPDVYAQHVLNSGTVDARWPANGLALCTADGGQGRGSITSDGTHGAVVAWTDGRLAGTFHIFAQHALASGTVDPAWPLNGRAISNAGVLESRPLAIPDGAGGAIVNWQAFTVHLNMYAQHVLATGIVDPAWPAGGRALSLTNRQQDHAGIVPDGVGGAVVAWEDSFNVIAQHVFASGALDPAFPDTGRVVCGLPSSQGVNAVVATGGGGAIVVWTDARKGIDVDIYAMQILEVVPTGVEVSPPGGISFRRSGPNPGSGPLALRFGLPHASRIRLAIFDVAGRRVRELASGTRAAGEHTVTWDLRDQGGRSVGAGLYFARLEADGQSFTQKLVTIP